MPLSPITCQQIRGKIHTEKQKGVQGDKGKIKDRQTQKVRKKGKSSGIRLKRMSLGVRSGARAHTQTHDGN